MQLSFLHVIDRKHNFYKRYIGIIQINHSVLSQRHCYRSRHRAFHSGIDMKIPEIRIIYSYQSSMIVPSANYQRRRCSRKFLLRSIPRIALLLGPAKLRRESHRYVKSGYRRNRTPRDYHLVGNFA